MSEVVLASTLGNGYPYVPAKTVYQSRKNYISLARYLKAYRGGAKCATRAGPVVRKARSSPVVPCGYTH
jgi:hypothetical protein